MDKRGLLTLNDSEFDNLAAQLKPATAGSRGSRTAGAAGQQGQQDSRGSRRGKRTVTQQNERLLPRISEDAAPAITQGRIRVPACWHVDQSHRISSALPRVLAVVLRLGVESSQAVASTKAGYRASRVGGGDGGGGQRFLHRGSTAGIDGSDGDSNAKRPEGRGTTLTI